MVPLLEMVIGVNDLPRPMSVAKVQEFGDPFTTLILLKGQVPLTLTQLGAAIEDLAGDDARPLRKLYVVAEGAAFQSTNPQLPMNTRLVITWQKDTATPPDLLLSTSTDLDDPSSLLQLISWSEHQGVFHFFERTSAGWGWAGSSLHALQDASRGKGPFDSHINGGLVMKELKFPWNHWHSQSNGIPRDLIFESQEELNHPLFSQIEGAQDLELAVKGGVRRWTKRRVQRDLQGGQLVQLEWYARQILWTTSVNLVSTSVLSRRLSSVEELSLPRTFFFDEEGIKLAASLLSDLDVLPANDFSVKASLYASILEELEVHVEAEIAGLTIEGDTDFAFLVPERAFEDQAVLQELMRKEVLSPRLALCLLLVDFTNPVFSPVRAELLALFPSSIAQGGGGSALDTVVIDRARANPSPATQELLQLWDDQKLLTIVQRRLANFTNAVQTRLRTPEGVRDLLKLADSRKETFRQRKLNEFRHTTSINGATVTHLAMREDGTLFMKNSILGELEK
jgi:hypothetical protein